MHDVQVGEQVWSRHANQLRLRLKEPGQSQHTFGSLLDTFDLPTTTREMDDSSQTQCSRNCEYGTVESEGIVVSKRSCGTL
uniref:DNA-directed RNA polymerase n=1 Tax=Heterorhabditis bacteriophora TaxID=37862 RepID=A0A1I7XM81_HETBA